MPPMKIQTPHTIRRALGPSLVLAALALTLLLSSCAYSATSDPLLAAQVNGSPISMTEYQAILPVYIASYEISAQGNATSAASVPLVDWRIPSQRPTYTQIQQTVLTFLINLSLQQQLLSEQHITVPASAIRDAEAQINSVRVSNQQQFNQDPTNTALQALVASLTPTAIHILAEQQAGAMTFGAHGKIPQAHIYELTVKTRQQAEQLQTQAEHGANFTDLARKYSTDSSAATTGGDLGILYVGQLPYEIQQAQQQQPGISDGGFGATFDRAVFAPTQAPAYVILTDPNNGGYSLLHIVARTQAPLADVKDATKENGYLSNWIAGNLYTAATIHRYLANG